MIWGHFYSVIAITKSTMFKKWVSASCITSTTKSKKMQWDKLLREKSMSNAEILFVPSIQEHILSMLLPDVSWDHTFGKMVQKRLNLMHILTSLTTLQSAKRWKWRSKMKPIVLFLRPTPSENISRERKKQKQSMVSISIKVVLFPEMRSE